MLNIVRISYILIDTLPRGAKFCRPSGDSKSLDFFSRRDLPLRFCMMVEIRLGLVLIMRQLQLTRFLQIIDIPPAGEIKEL